VSHIDVEQPELPPNIPSGNSNKSTSSAEELKNLQELSVQAMAMVTNGGGDHAPPAAGATKSAMVTSTSHPAISSTAAGGKDHHQHHVTFEDEGGDDCDEELELIESRRPARRRVNIQRCENPYTRT
jgi:hypothetical protein